MNLFDSALLAAVIHESGHVLTAAALGVKVKRIGISRWGLYTVRERGTELQNGLIKLAGPMANLLTAVICFQLQIGSAVLWISLWVAFFNLLPIRYSDGSALWQMIKAVNNGRQ